MKEKKKNKDNRVDLRERIDPKTLRLIESEAKGLGIVNARAIDQIIPRGCVTEEAKELLREFAETDPLIQAVVKAMDERKQHVHQSKTNSRTN